MECDYISEDSCEDASAKLDRKSAVANSQQKLARLENLDISYFSPHPMKHPALAGSFPLTTCVKILSETQQIAFSSSNSPDIRFAKLKNNTLELTASLSAEGTAVSIEPSADTALNIITIGEIKPTERRIGKLFKHADAESPLITELHRSVSSKPFDANGDGLEDFVICEYGHHTGRLSWLEKKPDRSHEKHIILKKANPIVAIPADVDSDGDTDIYALFAGGSEGIWLFESDGKDDFSGRELVSFPPSTGSASLNLADIDGDGDTDIVLGCMIPANTTSSTPHWLNPSQETLKSWHAAPEILLLENKTIQ